MANFDTVVEGVEEHFSRFEAETAELVKHSAQLALEKQLTNLEKNQQQQLAQLRRTLQQQFQHTQLIETNQ